MTSSLKRFLSVVLTLGMVLSMFAATLIGASAAVDYPADTDADVIGVHVNGMYTTFYGREINVTEGHAYKIVTQAHTEDDADSIPDNTRYLSYSMLGDDKGASRVFIADYTSAVTAIDEAYGYTYSVIEETITASSTGTAEYRLVYSGNGDVTFYSVSIYDTSDGDKVVARILPAALKKQEDQEGGPMFDYVKAENIMPISNCDDMTGWASYPGDNIGLDTDNKTEGTGSIKLWQGGGFYGGYYFGDGVTMDFSNVTAIRFDFYANTSDALSDPNAKVGLALASNAGERFRDEESIGYFVEKEEEHDYRVFDGDPDSKNESALHDIPLETGKWTTVTVPIKWDTAGASFDRTKVNGLSIYGLEHSGSDHVQGIDNVVAVLKNETGDKIGVETDSVYTTFYGNNYKFNVESGKKYTVKARVNATEGESTNRYLAKLQIVGEETYSTKINFSEYQALSESVDPDYGYAYKTISAEFTVNETGEVKAALAYGGMDGDLHNANLKTYLIEVYEGENLLCSFNPANSTIEEEEAGPYWKYIYGTKQSRTDEAVEAVIAAINELPEAADVTAEDGDAITAASDAFYALSPEQQEKVTNKDKLEAVIKAYNELDGFIISSCESVRNWNPWSGDSVEAVSDRKTEGEKSLHFFNTGGTSMFYKFGTETDFTGVNYLEFDILPAANDLFRNTADGNTIRLSSHDYSNIDWDNGGNWEDDVLDIDTSSLKEYDLKAGEWNHIKLRLTGTTLGNFDITKVKKLWIGFRAYHPAVTPDDGLTHVYLDNVYASREEIPQIDEAVVGVIEKINALPETITVNDKDAVEAARKAYDQLSEEQKANVGEETYAKLQKAETDLAAAIEAAEKEAEKAAAKADLDAKIAAIPETLDAENHDAFKSATEAARAAYNEYVEKYTNDGVSDSAIVDAENKLKEFETVKPGDMDKNGKIEALDALRVLQIAVGKYEASEEEMNLADVDQSGKVDVNDALQVLQMSVGKITEYKLANK